MRPGRKSMDATMPVWGAVDRLRRLAAYSGYDR